MVVLFFYWFFSGPLSVPKWNHQEHFYSRFTIIVNGDSDALFFSSDLFTFLLGLDWRWFGDTRTASYLKVPLCRPEPNLQHYPEVCGQRYPCSSRPNSLTKLSELLSSSASRPIPAPASQSPAIVWPNPAERDPASREMNLPRKPFWPEPCLPVWAGFGA